MKRRKDIILGGAFLLAAVFVIIGSMGLFGDISVWTILFTFCLALCFLKSLIRLRWGGMLFSLAFLAILHDELLGIQELTPWPVLFAAFLGSSGLNIIFKGKSGGFKKVGACKWEWKWNEQNSGDVEQLEDEHKFHCEVAFGSVSKYIKCQSLSEANIENSFGSSVIYFDGAALENGIANVNVENAFGEIKLFIPAEWSMNLKSDEAFGRVKEIGCASQESNNHLNITCDTAFGNIEIHYI